MLPSLDGKTQRIASAEPAVAPPTTRLETVSRATADSMRAVASGSQPAWVGPTRLTPSGRGHSHRFVATATTSVWTRTTAARAAELPIGKRPVGGPRRPRRSWVAPRLLLIPCDGTHTDRDVASGGRPDDRGGGAGRCGGAGARPTACLPQAPCRQAPREAESQTEHRDPRPRRLDLVGDVQAIHPSERDRHRQDGHRRVAQLITVGEAYELFLDALGSVGLTAYPEGRFMRIIETSRAKTSAIPVITDDP